MKNKTLTIDIKDEIPDAGEEDPGRVEGDSEYEESPGPGQVYHWREEVFQIPETIFLQLQLDGSWERQKLVNLSSNPGPAGRVIRTGAGGDTPHSV